MNQLYEEIDDKYEVVIFIANQSESDKTYSGYSKSISNNERNRAANLLLGRVFWF